MMESEVFFIQVFSLFHVSRGTENEQCVATFLMSVLSVCAQLQYCQVT